MNEQKIKLHEFKIFDLYDLNDVKIYDPGLKSVINLKPKLILKSQGRNVQKLGQTKINIVERLMNRLAVAGHRGKKHKIIFGHSTGKYSKNMKIVLESFKLIEQKTKQNPVQVLVKAIENSAPRDETTAIEYGGARYPQAVDCSPQRRVDVALKMMVQGSYQASFGKKKSMASALADEIMLAHKGEQKSTAIAKKLEMERMADAAH